MKFTSACSSGTFGRNIILLLMVIVVIILIIALFFKPTAIQLVPKLLKITWKHNQLKPHSLLPAGEASSMVLEMVKFLFLSCFYIPSPLEESRATLSHGNQTGHIFVPTCSEIARKMKVKDCSLRLELLVYPEIC